MNSFPRKPVIAVSPMLSAGPDLSVTGTVAAQPLVPKGRAAVEMPARRTCPAERGSSAIREDNAACRDREVKTLDVFLIVGVHLPSSVLEILTVIRQDQRELSNWMLPVSCQTTADSDWCVAWSQPA